MYFRSRVVSCLAKCACIALFGLSLRADTVTYTNSASTTLNVGGTLSLDGYNNSSTFSGTQNSSDNLLFQVGPPSLPAGSSLTSALLTLSGAATNIAPVPTPPPSQQIGEYVSGSTPVYTNEFVSYPCGLFNSETCYTYELVQTGSTPIYSSGTSGLASFSSLSSATFTTLQIGGTTVVLPSSGGIVDLLSLGLGPDLLAGDTLTVNGTATLNLNSSVLSNGYYSTTVYSASASSNPDLTGTLDLTYSADSVPEPASSLLAAVGLFAVALSARKLRTLILR